MILYHWHQLNNKAEKIIQRKLLDRLIGRMRGHMEKYKVLIIDDEPVIVEGLKVVIDWEELGCEIIGTAFDGASGLLKIKELQPDIVISDIRMPNTTGIEMIRTAISVCSCKFIVLSGYSDFSYAKQCISLGVTEYILKPVEEELLTGAINKVQAQLEKERKEQNTITQLKNYNKQLSFLAKDYSLRDFVNSYFETENDMYSVLNSYEIALPKSAAYTCAVLQLTDYNGSVLELREQLDSAFSAVLKDNYILFLYNENSFMCIIGLSDDKESSKLPSDLSAVKKYINDTVKCQINIGLGNIYSTPLKINAAAKQSLYALSFKIIRGENSVNPFSSSLKGAHFIVSLPNELWENYRQSIIKLNTKDISSSIFKIYEYIRDFSNMPILGVQINSLNIVLICIQQLNEMDTFYTLNYSEMDCFSQISKLDSLDEIAKYTENVVYNLISKIKNTDTKKPAGIISQIENYLYDHVYEDLSLISIAQLFYLSPIYLSQLFKKETGQLYIDYVTNLKINAAKNLLLSSDSRIYEISDKLGYKDNKYFSRLFEKKVGCKPSEFRKKPF